MLKSLPLTVVVHEGPMARAYLGMLRETGWRARHVLLLVSKRDPALGRPVARWWPEAIRRPWARALQDQRMNHWPRHFMRQHGTWVRPWLARLLGQHGMSSRWTSCLTDPPSYRLHGEQVDEVMIDTLDDPVLAERLLSLPAPGCLLFTGGGLLRQRTLHVPGQRWLHVHPGHLPEVRGADGLLWSILLRGRPGASAFYMAQGLDTGDIVQAQDLPVPILPACWPQLDNDSRYRLLYAFVDPLLRAVALRGLLESASVAPALATGRLDQLACSPQQEVAGQTFRFMHQRLRQAAYERLWQLQCPDAEPRP